MRRNINRLALVAGSLFVCLGSSTDVWALDTISGATGVRNFADLDNFRIGIVNGGVGSPTNRIVEPSTVGTSVDVLLRCRDSWNPDPNGKPCQAMMIQGQTKDPATGEYVDDPNQRFFILGGEFSFSVVENFNPRTRTAMDVDGDGVVDSGAANLGGWGGCISFLDLMHFELCKNLFITARSFVRDDAQDTTGKVYLRVFFTERAGHRYVICIGNGAPQAVMVGNAFLPTGISGLLNCFVIGRRA